MITIIIISSSSSGIILECCVNDAVWVISLSDDALVLHVTSV